jgi:hypothetical protein
MKFTNILFVGAAMVDATDALKLENKHINSEAAISAAHAASAYAK